VQIRRHIGKKKGQEQGEIGLDWRQTHTLTDGQIKFYGNNFQGLACNKRTYSAYLGQFCPLWSPLKPSAVICLYS
jgi:hypothetical protein